MNAFLIWYRSRPTDGLRARLRGILDTVGAEITGENTTIDAGQVPVMMSAALGAGDIAVVIGGMNLLHEDDNIVYILSRCMHLPLETGEMSRSQFCYDMIRGSRLPTFESSVLFPSSAGGPEGVLLVCGNQTLLLLPWLEGESMDMLSSIEKYFSRLVPGAMREELIVDEPDQPENRLPEYIEKHALSEEVVRKHENRSAMQSGQLRAMFAHIISRDDVSEDNREALPPARTSDGGSFANSASPGRERRVTVRRPQISGVMADPVRRSGMLPTLRVLSILLILAIIGSSCYVAFNYYESGLMTAPAVYQSELTALFADDGSAESLPEGVLPEFARLYKTNGDVRGYLSIPGTELAQPIMASAPDAPDAYSRIDFYGNADERGSLYFDIADDISAGTENQNLIVHGNNPTDGSLFALLEKYTDAAFLSEHQLINMSTLYDSAQWVVFAVCYASGDTVSEFNWANNTFAGQYAHQLHLYNLYIRSLYYTSAEVFPNDRILTLVTDTDDFEGCKLLVCARRVREDEDLSYTANPAVANDLVLMPDLYYVKNETERPDVPQLEIPTETTTTASSAATTAAATAPKPTSPPEGGDVPADVSGSDAGATTAATAATTAPTTMAAPSNTPTMRITSNGKVISGSAADILAKIVEAEMGGSSSLEALKAQAVAAYTFYLYSGGSARAPSFPTKTPEGRSKEAAKAVAGQYMSFGGVVPYTPYYAISAGHTANNKDINGADLSYLTAVDCSVDESVKGYRVVKEMSAAEVAKKVKTKKGIDLTKISDKSTWFEVLSRDQNDLYVTSVKVGDKTYKGNTLHLSILGYSCLRSPAFWIEYDASRDVFVFTSLGYGTGVGMSQTGADAYARQGHNYVWILQHFYTGVTIKT